MQEDFRLLKNRVESFEIDPGEKSLSFARRLARENRWSFSYSQRVIREYKRFCILALTSGHHVTPSEAVDQAWHLHLTYTRSYWDRFCKEALRRPLHHEPTSGGSKEGKRFHSWYSETLKSYERLFEEAPPQDIWPSPTKRFQHAGQDVWVNPRHYWLIPRFFIVPLVAILILSFLLLLPGCTPILSPAMQPAWLTPILVGGVFPFNLSGEAFLLFYAAVCAAGLIAVIILRSLAQPVDSRAPIVPVHNLNVEEVAVLSGGGSRLAYVCLTRLYSDKRFDIEKSGWFSKSNLIAKPSDKPITSPIDRDLYAEIEKRTDVKELIKAVKPHYDRIREKLTGLNLRDDTSFHSSPANTVIVCLLVLGILRIFQGLSVGQEIRFLILLTIAFSFVAFLINFRQVKLTPEGVAYVESGKQRVAADWSSLGNNPTLDSYRDLILMNLALTGVSAVAGLEGFRSLTPVFQNMSNQSVASGCGAGCGSGCGGGGCGGGGCGGGGD